MTLNAPPLIRRQTRLSNYMMPALRLFYFDALSLRGYSSAADLILQLALQTILTITPPDYKYPNIIPVPEPFFPYAKPFSAQYAVWIIPNSYSYVESII